MCVWYYIIWPIAGARNRVRRELSQHVLYKTAQAAVACQYKYGRHTDVDTRVRTVFVRIAKRRTLHTGTRVWRVFFIVLFGRYWFRATGSNGEFFFLRDHLHRNKLLTICAQTIIAAGFYYNPRRETHMDLTIVIRRRYIKVNSIAYLCSNPIKFCDGHADDDDIFAECLCAGSSTGSRAALARANFRWYSIFIILYNSQILLQHSKSMYESQKPAHLRTQMTHNPHHQQQHHLLLRLTRQAHSRQRHRQINCINPR